MEVIRNLNIIQHRHVTEQTNVLEGSGNPLLSNLIRFQTDNALSVKNDFPFGRFVYAGQQVKGRGFASSVWAD